MLRSLCIGAIWGGVLGAAVGLMLGVFLNYLERSMLDDPTAGGYALQFGAGFAVAGAAVGAVVAASVRVFKDWRASRR